MGVRKVWPRFYPTLDGGGDSDGEKVFQRVEESCQDCCVKVREGKSGLPRMCFVTISALVILLSHPQSSMALTNKGECRKCFLIFDLSLQNESDSRWLCSIALDH